MAIDWDDEFEQWYCDNCAAEFEHGDFDFCPHCNTSEGITMSNLKLPTMT